jgi:predicted transposase YbfD/YdcC
MLPLTPVGHGFLIKLFIDKWHNIATLTILISRSKKMTTISSLNETELTENYKKFINEINKLPDTRDNRGKKHSLSFLIISVVFAMLSNRSKVSSIHRYMKNKLNWLRETTGIENATLISRAHLPRMLAGINWEDLNLLIYECFSTKIIHSIENEWIAVDGKVLRGTLKSGEKQGLVHAVSQDSRIDVAQARMVGDKSSEITVVRDFIKETGLEQKKISLDAHHCNPDTLGQIEQAGGTYLVQVKENQPILLQQCKELAQEQSKKVFENQSVDSGHGRITARCAKIFPMTSVGLDSRWQESNIDTLVVMRRETFDISMQKMTTEDSYYLSNQKVDTNNKGVELADVIRKHWGVESNNWILDVTFNEDKVQVKEGNQAQVMGKLRCFATNLLRWSGAKNFQEKIEAFIDQPSELISMLSQVNFL